MSSHLSGPSPTPPLLLTKRLNAFLHANQTPHLPTLLLTTSHGKLLAHASPHPVALLRTHATVAASLLAIHTSASLDVPSALPGARTPDDLAAASPATGTDDDDDGRDDDDEGDDEDDDDEDDDDDDDSLDDDRHGADALADAEGRALARRRSGAKSVQPAAITVQLSGGTVVIRRLKCGLLFVTIGPSAHEQLHHPVHDPEHHPHPHPHHHENGEPGGSPSEVESVASTGCQTTSSLESAGAASVVAMRRHTGELARWLDDKLGTLCVPDEDVSVAVD